MKKHIIGTLAITAIGAIIGAVVSYALYPTMGASVFILVAAVAGIAGIIGGSLVSLWANWN